MIPEHNNPTINNTTIQTSKSNTVSDLSFPNSLQQTTDSSQFITNSFSFSHQNWPNAESHAYLDHEKTLVQIEHFVRSFLFHRLKFISAPEMNSYSKDSKSLCQLICGGFKVKENEQHRFWSLYSKTVVQKLNKKRAEVSNAIWKLFKGKLFNFKFISIAF